MRIVAKPDKDGRWCAEPIFEATVKNSSLAPVWLDVGKKNGTLVATSWFVTLWTNRRGSSYGSASGMSDDWGSIEYLRSPNATMLKPGESVERRIRLEDVHLSSGRATVNVGLRIDGTQDLGETHVHTYEPMAEQEVVLRRSGRCLEVRRLTGR